MDKSEHHARTPSIEERLLNLERELKQTLGAIESKIDALAQLIEQSSRANERRGSSADSATG